MTVAGSLHARPARAIPRGPGVGPGVVPGRGPGRPDPASRVRLTRDATDAAARRKLERELRVAVEVGAFLLHYQPQFALGDGRLVSMEGLIRWPDRKRGLVAPATFLPIAEQSGLIDRIGAWVLDTACSAARDWIGAGVSINVSAEQLRNGSLPGQLSHALDVSGLAPERLVLELTETMLIDGTADTLLTLSAIRDLGVGLALDDFGTGFASLSMLKRLPLTALKLDRTMIRELPTNREDAAIVRAVIAAGHAMGLTVVAEGIETEPQRAFLAGIGCDEGQGYLFSHPLPLHELHPLLGIPPDGAGSHPPAATLAWPDDQP